MIALVLGGGAALGVIVWVLAKLGKALIKIAEALAAAAVVLFVLWLVIKAVAWALRQVLTHWRTSLTVLAMVAWWHWRWASLVLTAGVVAGVLTGWRLIDLASFDAWAGSASAGLVAALDGLRPEAAPVAARLRPEHQTRRHANGSDGQSARAQPPSHPKPSASAAAPGARGAVRGVVGRGPRPTGARPNTRRLRPGRAGVGLG